MCILPAYPSSISPCIIKVILDIHYIDTIYLVWSRYWIIIVLSWYIWIIMVLSWYIWIIMVLSWYIWIIMVLSWYIWIIMVLSWYIWIIMVLSWYIWIIMVLSWYIWIIMVLSWYILYDINISGYLSSRNFQGQHQREALRVGSSHEAMQCLGGAVGNRWGYQRARWMVYTLW